MRNLPGRALAVLPLLACTLGLRAAPIAYEFDLTITAGPLTGEVYSGTFSFDAGLVAPGEAITGGDFFDSLAFVFHGTAYHPGNTSLIQLQWDAAGTLIDFVFGNVCDAGRCGDIVPGTESWTMIASAFPYSIVGAPEGYVSEGPVFRRVVAPPPVPEPGSLALLVGAALAAAQLQRRRRAR